MQSLTQSVKESLNTIKLGIERIESEKCSGIVQMKAELRTLKDVVKGIQDSVDNVQLAHLSSQGTKLSKKQKIQHPKDVGAQNIHINNENGIRTIGSSVLPKDFLAEPYTGTSITNYTDIPRSSNTGVSDNEGIGYEDSHTAHVAQNDNVATMQSTSTVSAPLNEICATDQSGNAYSCHSAQTQPFIYDA